MTENSTDLFYCYRLLWLQYSRGVALIHGVHSVTDSLLLERNVLTPGETSPVCLKMVKSQLNVT